MVTPTAVKPSPLFSRKAWTNFSCLEAVSFRAAERPLFNFGLFSVEQFAGTAYLCKITFFRLYITYFLSKHANVLPNPHGW